MTRGSASGSAIGARWVAVRKTAGYGAALTMSFYLVVKLIWIAALLRGGGQAGMVVLNAVTVGMSATGVTLGLALARPWGRRLPAPPVILIAWVAAGFLVPMLPYMLIGAGMQTAGAGAEEASAAAPDWDMILITVGFIGMGVGLAVALPIYMRERWPHAFLGRVGDVLSRSQDAPRSPVRTGESRRRPPRFAAPATAAAVVLGLLWLYWAAGGTLGLDPAHRDHWDLNGRLLNASAGIWALISAWSLRTLTRHRPARLPLWLPTTLAFAGSGSLFAWSCWKLPMAILRPTGYAMAEYLPVAVLQHLTGIATGAAALATVLRLTRPGKGDVAGM
ncbi:hypothetical protein [Sphaerisporangium fuscum]|uniref:hypothetical protein n=1 Tax=Sphaerisporangium fuscum TaxID=2835868 RepID=UPI001BDDADEC|nr:hypothetical protein [Sphaerisporangium fuscum]